MSGYHDLARSLVELMTQTTSTRPEGDLAYLGFKPSGGAYAIKVSGRPNWIWVRLEHGQSRAPVQAFNAANVRRIPDCPVRVKTVNGALHVIGYDEASIATFLGTTPLDSAEPGMGAIEPVSARRLLPGLVHCYKVAGSYGLSIYVEPFPFFFNGASSYWPGGALDLTGYLPATAGMKAWVKVGHDPATNSLAAVTGTPVAPLVPLARADLDALALPDCIALAGLKVVGGQTAIDDERTLTDVRPWWLAGNALSLLKHNLSASAAPTPTDDADSGYGVGSEWIDGTTGTPYKCVDATAGSAAWVNMTGGGSGGAGGSEAIVTTKTLQTRTVLYDNTLASDGVWDVDLTNLGGVDVSAQYDHLELIFGGKSASGDAEVRLYFNNDTTDGNYRFIEFASTHAAVSDRAEGDYPRIGATVGTGVSSSWWSQIRIEIPYYRHSGIRRLVHGYGGDRGGESDVRTRHAALQWENTAAITRVKLCAGGTTSENWLTGSRLQLVGIKAEEVVTGVTGIAPFRHVFDLNSAALSGAGVGALNLGTGGWSLPALLFDADTEESATWCVPLPGGLPATFTATLTLHWTTTGSTGAVVWRAVSLSRANHESLDVVGNTDTFTADGVLGATDDHAISQVLTTTGWGAGELLLLRIVRVAADAGDTMSGDAYLLGATLELE